MVGLPTSGGTEKDLQLNFGLTVNDQVEMLAPFLPAEWFLQSGIQHICPVCPACRDRLGIYVD